TQDSQPTKPCFPSGLLWNSGQQTPLGSGTKRDSNTTFTWYPPQKTDDRVGFSRSWDVCNPDNKTGTSRSGHISRSLPPSAAISPKTREETDQLMHTRGSNARRPHTPRRARLGERKGGTSQRTPADPRGSGLTLPG